VTRGKRIVVSLAALGLSISLVTGCAGGAAARPGGGAAAKSTGDPTRGKALFAQTCSACHGPDARGLPGLGKDMTTSAFVKDQTDSQLVEFVKQGRPATDPANTTKVDMPPKGGNQAMTDAQLADVIAYLRTLQR
jgi:disulfide bond formation protein DsbB